MAINVKKYDQFLKVNEDDDYKYLNKMLKLDSDDPRLRFELPDNFVGGKNVLRPKNPAYKMALKEGDRIIYNNPKSEHNGKKGVFKKIREDGKFSVVFDDGTKFAANGNNVQGYKDELSKNDIVLRFHDLADGSIGVVVMKGAEAFKTATTSFPELERMDFIEDNSGMLIYKGDLTKDELISDLKERDFVVE